MATYQTDYGVTPGKGYPGMIANEEKCNKISRTVQNSAGILFGQPAFRGSIDHGVLAGGTFAATGAGSAAAGNVGAGAITASPTITAPAQQGRYEITILNTGATADFSVKAPDGSFLVSGNVGSAYSSGGLAFTITDPGTDPNAGDLFYVDVTFTANGDFIGIAVLTEAVPPVASGSSLVDGYPQYFTGAFMTMGQMYVTAGAAVTDGAQVYWNPATSRYTANAAHIKIDGATFDTSGGDGDLVEISLKLR
jgi:hypothetical protein